MNEGMIYDENVERKVYGSVPIEGNLRVYEAVKKAKRP